MKSAKKPTRAVLTMTDEPRRRIKCAVKFYPGLRTDPNAPAPASAVLMIALVSLMARAKRKAAQWQIDQKKKRKR